MAIDPQARANPLVPPLAELESTLRRRTVKHPFELLILGFLFVCATISLLTTFAVVLVLATEAWSFFNHVPFSKVFLTPGDAWIPQEGFGITSYDMWDLIFGTANVLFWSMLMAVPVALAAAIYLNEYAPMRVRQVLKPALEALAGIPTVVYGFFALTFITPVILDALPFVDVPLFNAFSASIVMAVMILPTIASVSEDAMANVPRELREGAYGLGATKLEVATKVTIPAALGGIAAGIILAVARVVGETMIVAMAAGSTPNQSLNPLESIQTMTGYMLQIGLGDAARGTIEYEALFAVGFTLFLMTLTINVIAHRIVQRFREKYE